LSYPGIEFATKEMAYDNGCINRDRSEEDLIRGLYNWLRDVDPETFNATTLQMIDVWLSSLAEKDMHLLCAGEEGEQHDVLMCAPVGIREYANLLLTLIFEEVL